MTTQQEAIQRVIEKRASRPVEDIVEEDEPVDSVVEAPAEEDVPEEEPAEEPEPAEEEEDEVEEPSEDDDVEAVEDEFFIGRYRNREEAERGLSEKDATIQRLYDERNQQLQQRREEPAGEVDVEQWAEWVESQLGSRPGGEILQRALQEAESDYQAQQLTEIVFGVMHASEDPFVRAQGTQLAIDYRLAYQQVVEQQRRAPEQARQQAADTQREAVQARKQMMGMFPDYEEVEPEMNALLDSLDGHNRVILEEVAKAGPEGKQFVLWSLYNAARSGSPDRLVNAKVAQARKADERSRSKKIAASVASATASPERTPLTEAEREDIVVKNRIRKAAGLPLIDEGED